MDRLAAGSAAVAALAPNSGGQNGSCKRRFPEPPHRPLPRPLGHAFWPAPAPLESGAPQPVPAPHASRDTRRRSGSQLGPHAATGVASRAAFVWGDLGLGCDAFRAPGAGVLAIVRPSAGAADGRAGDPIAPVPAGQSIPAARCSRRPGLPRSHPDSPSACRIGSSGRAPPAVVARRASPRRTWPLLVVW